MHEIHHTEVGGYQASWRLEGHRVAIMVVRCTSDVTPIASYGPGSYPDLARARELLPHLTGLWDAVRHDFWSRLLPRHRPSSTTGSI
ncbi:hypothetical protein LTT66_22390 [Nocardia gipuzkoensis]|uniref:hypothetical protein n=1 Tax=Nocardia gipuzkoensis TaxID=2749991 RepID=UPI001E379EFB|nr:hypothetical protein [Nocardia gipuzkoensis]UGT66053.1 hypothetical protein LTT66_22390 [Nocardia gipuzkoensis]